MADIGRLKVQCFRRDDYVPVDGAKITIRGTGEFATTRTINLTTNSSGLTEEIEVDAPPLEYSLNQNSNKLPYSLYDITVERENYEPLVIRGCQVFPGQVAYQVCNLNTDLGRGDTRQVVINILPNTLNGNFPPKIPEEVDKPLPPPTSGVVLPQPVVPEYIIVHQGSPNDTSAPNYKVDYKDYIKNVASCEIYSTWPETTIRANIFCIISFTLNRIYTEWYRGKGKNFDITSSTAYDHAFNYGRNIYDSISAIVDEIFSTYIRRIGSKQPLLTQYCDGKNVKCPEWLSQWGSKYLGDQGKLPYEILMYYYGSNIELVTAERVEGSPQSYPGYDLTTGSTGEPVRVIQEQLNRIAQNYPLIPKVAQDGSFGQTTAEAVRTFQGIFALPQNGVVDYATWYKISDVYVGVTKIAELRGSTSRIFVPPVNPSLNDDVKIPSFYY
ncbi:MAG: spore cortex-lytic protein [Clostridium butyricum]|nr:spore cortex-lytic protein [Clostridium butyricum]